MFTMGLTLKGADRFMIFICFWCSSPIFVKMNDLSGCDCSACQAGSLTKHSAIGSAGTSYRINEKLSAIGSHFASNSYCCIYKCCNHRCAPGPAFGVCKLCGCPGYTQKWAPGGLPSLLHWQIPPLGNRAEVGSMRNGLVKGGTVAGRSW